MPSFENFIEKNYPGMNYLTISDATYKPGVILNGQDTIIDGLSHVFHDQPADKWKTKTVDARISGETIQGERNLDLGGSVLGMFSLKSGVSAKYSVSFEFDKATAIVFDTDNGGVYENDIRELVHGLKDSDRSRWKDQLHQYVVVKTIYVDTVTVDFKRNGQVLAKADIEQLKNEININGSFDWNASGSMQISNNATPFGVMGFEIKRFS